jgi:protein-S-isoprenylcysteine O-methyltransferase Ste14
MGLSTAFFLLLGFLWVWFFAIFVRHFRRIERERRAAPEDGAGALRSGRGLPALALQFAGVVVEEKLLAERFGSEFERYRARVKAYLPFLR